MKKIRRKIVLACSAVLTLLITTVTTTFAWFSLNESAWLEKMELEVNNMNNLLITADYDVDASNMMFKQYLTAEDIVAAINKKRELNGEVAINSLDDIISQYNQKTLSGSSDDNKNFYKKIISALN